VNKASQFQHVVVLGMIVMIVLGRTDPCPGQYTFKRFYDLHDGIAPGWINDISQDLTGNLWFCNRNGLSKFDGRNFVSYYANAGDTACLQAAETFDIAHLPNGDAWVATSRGLSKFHIASNTFTTFATADGLSLDLVKEVLIENDSTLWTGHWWGLDRINTRTMDVQNYRPYPDRDDAALLYRSLNNTSSLKRSPFSGDIYSAHTLSLFRYNAIDDVLAEVLPGRSASQDYISDFDWLNDSTIIIGMAERNYIIELNLNTNNTRQVVIPGVTDLAMVVRLQDGQIILVDKHAGLLEYPARFPESNQIALPDDVAPDQRAIYLCFIQDNAGRRWSGTQSGLALFEIPRTRLFRSPRDIEIFYAVYDSITNVCITSGYGGSIAWIRRGRTFTPMDYSLSDILPWSIEFSPHQRLFYSIEDTRLIAFHPATSFKREFPLSSIINSAIISGITSDSLGFTVSHGRQLLQIQYTGQIDTLFENGDRIFDFISRGADLFFSGLGTIERQDHTGRSQTIYRENLLVPPRNLSIVGDTALWFSQIHTGLVKIDLMSPGYPHTIYGPDKGVTSQIIQSVVLLDDQLLLSAGFCMLTVDLATETVTDVLINSDGHIHTEFVDRIHPLDDQYYFTTDPDGMRVFQRHWRKDTLCGLRIQSIQIGNAALRYHSENPLTLRHHENDISIHLETCYYGQDRDLNYAYKLKQSDPWIETGQSSLLNFTNLMPGAYRIHARVGTSDGQRLELRQPVILEIFPPWWQTLWFRLLVVCVVAGSMYLYYRGRISRLKERHSVETKLIRLEQIALKSQMNPHFLFNCLNGIRTLISLKEEDQAVAYVNHLSKLLRDTLLHHEDALIPLDKEIEMTENYLTLGKLRFGDKISWTMDIDKTVNPTSIHVPPFVLQPLVENAMWHGIKHLETPGVIQIIIERKSTQVIIKVLDNGIGLQKAAELQKSQLRTRKHIGLSLVRKRLEAINGRLTIQERDNSTGVASIIYLNSTNHV
jgi:hypothetical protein